MLDYYTKANKFGLKTYTVPIAADFKIDFLEKGVNAYEVQMLQRGWINFKPVLTFQCELPFEETIVFTFEQLYSYFANRTDIEWSQAQKMGKLNQVLQQFRR